MASQYRTASDGIRARIAGPRTTDKLAYMEKYCQAFMKAMAPKRASGKWDKLVYIDLLSGPGRCIEKVGDEEYDGSALRALKITPKFDHLYLCEKSSVNVKALKKRIPTNEIQNVSIFQGDCNRRVAEILKEFSPNTLAVAFLDPAGFEVHFSTLQALSTKPVDLIYLFPSGIGIARNLKTFIKRSTCPMDLFWDNKWRDLPAAKIVSGKLLTPEELDRFDRPWVRSYRAKVKELGYCYQDDDPPIFKNNKNGVLYHLLFFSKHQMGLTLWRGIGQIEPNKQRRFQFLEN